MTELDKDIRKKHDLGQDKVKQMPSVNKKIEMKVIEKTMVCGRRVSGRNFLFLFFIWDYYI